ncbi:MAG: helix-turn-helix domain-containing protein [Bacillota bacterium]
MDNVLGMRIRELRQNARLSQTQFANVLHVRNSTLSQYESGHRSPNDQIKRRIADYFNVSLDYLLGRTSETNPSAALKTSGVFTIEIDIRKRNMSKQELEDLRQALSPADDNTLRAIIQLLKIRSGRLVS